MRTSRTRFLLLVSALVALVAMYPAAAQPRDREPEADEQGTFEATVHTHSRQFGSPSSAKTLFGTKPLPAPVPEGKTNFSYSAIPCNEPAPFNDQALRFSPNPYADQGLLSPAPVRYRVQGTVIDGEAGTVDGKITAILCENDPNIASRRETNDRIIIEFFGTYEEVSPNEVVFTGTYRIVRGTGVFKDLEGQGDVLTGRFTCLPPILQREGAANCEQLGAYSDFVIAGPCSAPPCPPGLRGTFSDPTT